MICRLLICSLFVLYVTAAATDKGPRVGQAVSLDNYDRAIVEWGVNHLSMCNSSLNSSDSSSSANTTLQNNCTITGVYDYSKKVVAGFKHFFRVEFKNLNTLYKCEMTILEQSWLNVIKYCDTMEPICQKSEPKSTSTSTTVKAAVKVNKKS